MCVASAYFPGDLGEVPPPEVAAFVKYCKTQNKAFIIGCDANAHHTVWASKDINSRGECLLEYITDNEIDICNRGDVPTFINAIREEVLDLTLCSPTISDKIKNWHVSDEISLSDHKQILFEYEAGQQLIQTITDPRKTNWELYNTQLAEKVNTLAINTNTREELEESSKQLSNIIRYAFNQSCATKERSTIRDVPWWNNKLQKLRKKTRKLFNWAKRTQQWDQYKESLTTYNKEIRRSKRVHWRHTCENIENTPATARLQKILAKDHSNGLGTLKKEDGSFTTSANETLELMMKTHFPCSIINSNDDQSTSASGTGSCETRTNNHNAINDSTVLERQLAAAKVPSPRNPAGSVVGWQWLAMKQGLISFGKMDERTDGRRQDGYCNNPRHHLGRKRLSSRHRGK
ncbi:uncharacterized protein LOC134288683 [Aedes albopictus]|uniref:Endonuclease/exonuclease/phosphatase domain-containing protein n=1 Tax=Aedes albopictus TaxID=7160 RepID=A0ABM1YA33_AEDAL